MIGDGVRGVDDQVQDGLIDLPGVARHLRQVSEVGLEHGDVFVFVIRYNQSAANRLIQIGWGFIRLVRVSEFLHRAHNGGDSSETFDRAVERLGRVLQDEVQVGGLFRFIGEPHRRDNIPRRLHCILKIPVGLDHSGYIRH